MKMDLLTTKENLNIGIIYSKYNFYPYGERLLSELINCLINSKCISNENEIKKLEVPGAADLPIAATFYIDSLKLDSKLPDALILIGIVLKGKTNHHKVIEYSTAIGIQDISIRNKIPLINGIICAKKDYITNQRIKKRAIGYVNAAIKLSYLKKIN